MRRPGVLAAVLAWATALVSAEPIGTKLAFEPGRTTLSATAKAALDPLYDALVARPALRVVVVGHAIASDEPTARRRAEVVRWYLIDRGIETDRIDTRIDAESRAVASIDVLLAGQELSAAAPAATTEDGHAVAFDPASTTLSDAARRALEPALAALHARPELRLAILGNRAVDTDLRAARTARRRAEVVKWYLVDQGIETDRIATDVTSSPGAAAVSWRLVEETPPVAGEHDADDATQLASLLTEDGAAGSRSRIDLARQIAATRAAPATIGSSGAGFRGAGQTDSMIAQEHLPLARPTFETLGSGRRELPARTSPISERLLPSPPVSAEDVQRVISTRYMPALARCYRKTLATGLAVSGRIDVSFTVDTRGGVDEAQARGADPELETCIRAQMRGWRFQPRSASEEPASIHVTLVMPAS